MPVVEDEKKGMTVGQAIRAKCLDCSGGSYAEVARCHLEHCPLHPFRFGKNPYRKPRVMSDAQKEALAKHSFRK